ncbi:MAG: S26 family signal peptidase [Treponema sp.]|jgi:signal peptidase I|nr:S26 family signal peptidase [Treponema sp.]
MAHEKDFFDRLQELTERFLTRRRRLRRIKKEKIQAKNPLLDWLEAFLWAAGVVLIINQYLLQAYEIPSGSMIDTLLIKDRIFVNKIIYGPELLPGVFKLPSPIKPKRNDIIIFENPSYLSQGPVFDIAQRIIYMLTFSLVDIDRDKNGEPKAHFLIKRAAGMGGDLFVTDKGELSIRFAGETRWITEREYNAQLGLTHRISRLVEPGAYPALEAEGKVSAYRELGISPPEALAAEGTAAYNLRYYDNFALERARLEILRGAYPQDTRYQTRLAKLTLGWYVPEGSVFPLGDNRDNSRDARYFGPVRKAKVLGQGAIIYWPPRRMGVIR